MNFTKFLILAFFNVGIFCCLIFPAQASEIIWHGSDKITSPTVWKDGEIHIIADRAIFEVMPSGSLTLEAGTIVKVGFNAYIRVYSDFNVNGTKDKPVYFVSARDDSIGGDTNGDGSATSIDYGDWRGLQFDGSRYKNSVKVSIDHAIIKHGGGSHSTYSIGKGLLLGVFGVESFKITNSNLINNKGSIFTDAHSKNIFINNSNLYRDDCDYQNAIDGCQYSLSYTSFSSNPVDITNNYWGSYNGPTYTTGPDPEFYNGVVVANLMGNVSYLPFATEPIDFNEVEELKLNPVIVIPGLMGSWQDFNGEWKIDPILKTYDNLLEALRLAGYQDNQTLFTFPYQWRQSNIITAWELKNKINQVKELCVGENFDCSKVDLITHSMGGLVARQYITSNSYQDDVDQLIFIATPHRGAPKAYLMWEGGELEDTFGERIIKLIFKSEARKNGYKGDGAIANYIRANNFISTAELLPIYSYLFDNNFDLSNLRTYPNKYPRNLFLESLNSEINLNKLKQLKVLNIVAKTAGMDTLNALAVVDYQKKDLWPNGMPYNFYGPGEKGLFYGIGDQTVPNLSNNNFLDLAPMIIEADHGSVVSLSQKQIIKELTGIEPDYEISNSYLPNILLIIMNSPADFMIVDPLGRKIGRNLATSNLEAINELPESFFSGFGEDNQAEFVAITNPLPGDYQVKIMGTDLGGAYNLSWNYFDFEKEKVDSLDYDNYILNNQVVDLKINLTETEELSLLSEPEISISKAISDLDLLWERKLITNRVTYLKLLAFYRVLKIKVEVIDQLIFKLEQSNLGKISQKINFDKQLAKLRQDRDKLIISSFDDFDKELIKFLAQGYLKQLGYDIIKANNNYLIINW